MCIVEFSRFVAGKNTKTLLGMGIKGQAFQSANGWGPSLGEHRPAFPNNNSRCPHVDMGYDDTWN